ncbi:MAG: DUF4838 domain-containing protein [Terrimicrobiaceae bacterium]
MNHSYLHLLSLALFSATLLPISAAPGALAKEKQAKAGIVIASSATAAEKTAANELAEYFGKISGATFAIVEEKDFAGGPAIYVGWTEFAKKQGLDFAAFGDEESLLKTVGDSVVVGGGRPRGTLYAAYELLDKELGVRWYTPWVEHVPAKLDLTLAVLDRRFQPAYEYRYNNARDGGLLLRDVKLPERIAAPGITDTARWLARNRLNTGLKYITTWGPGGKWIEWPEEYGGQVVVKDPGSHSFAVFIPDEKYFKTHPEYFSMFEGKRVPQGDQSSGIGVFHLCLSNPELPKVFAENVIEWIKKNPDAYYVAIVPNDASRPMCMCKECEALALKYMPPGTVRDNQHEAGLILQFVNQVAEIVCKEFPKQRILTLSYNYSAAPPVGITAHPNVIVQMCAGGIASGMHINPNIPYAKKDLERYEGWEKVCKRLWVWDYQCGLVPSIDNFKPMLWSMDQMFKDYAKKGGYTGMFIEAEWNCPPVLPDCYELNTWLSARLMCDPGVDIEPLIREFCETMYGKAAPAMIALLELKKSRLPFYPLRAVTFDFMKKAQELMAEAEKAAAGDPSLLSRLADVRINLDLVALQYRHQLQADYLAAGGKPDAYPWPVAAVRQRILDSLERADNYWWYQRSAQYWKSSVTFDIYPHDKPQFREMLKEYLDVICQGPAMMPPLPPELNGIPRERIVDLAWPQLLGNVVTELELDPDAAMGMAVCVQTDKPWFVKNGRTPIPLFLYDASNTINYAGKRTPDEHGTMNSEVFPDKLMEGGYHWYSTNPGKIGPITRTVATKSWGHAVDLAGLYDPANPDQEWKVYWSIRLTGPNFPPFGKVYERDAILFDRMILVKCVPGEKLPETLTHIPAKGKI